MVKFKTIMLIMVVGLAIVLSGCIGKQEGTPTPIPTPILNPTPIITPIITPLATITATPLVTVIPKLPSDTLYVNAQIKKPVFWEADRYELKSVQIQIYNQQNAPLSITSQIVNGGLILEENRFTLQRAGSSHSYSNERIHFINNTNVTLRLLIKGYQPVEYNFIEIN